MKGNIRLFGDRYIAIRKPNEKDLAEMVDKIQIDERTWVGKDLGIISFEPYKHLFEDKTVYLISNRQHYEGCKPGDVTLKDLAHGWPIITINYSVSCVDKISPPNLMCVFSFWQDKIPRPAYDSRINRVFGPLIKDPHSDDTNIIRINPLAFGFSSTPKTIILALEVLDQLGVKTIDCYNMSADHTVSRKFFVAAAKKNITVIHSSAC